VEFEFISSGELGASYRIIDYGKPYHGKRVSIHSHAPRYCDAEGKPRFSYTPEEFERDVVGVVGYLRLESCLDGPLPVEVAVAFNEAGRRKYERAKARHPDWDWGPWEPPAKGVAQYVVGEGWKLTPLEEEGENG